MIPEQLLLYEAKWGYFKVSERLSKPESHENARNFADVAEFFTTKFLDIDARTEGRTDEIAEIVM